jgi:Cu(I)/Ag(I) efflux system membrane protein CusA/SilA
LVEDQITYPISTRFIAAPKVKFVRGESMFGKSFAVCHFRGWHGHLLGALARASSTSTRCAASLPEGVNPVIGPDATGVGWVYEYALVDRQRQTHDLADLRSLQDWRLRYALESVKGVWPKSRRSAGSSSSTRSISIPISPARLRQIPLSGRGEQSPIKASNGDVGGKIFEVGHDRVLRARGAVTSRAPRTSRTSR